MGALQTDYFQWFTLESLTGKPSTDFRAFSHLLQGVVWFGFSSSLYAIIITVTAVHPFELRNDLTFAKVLAQLESKLFSSSLSTLAVEECSLQVSPVIILADSGSNISTTISGHKPDYNIFSTRSQSVFDQLAPCGGYSSSRYQCIKQHILGLSSARRIGSQRGGYSSCYFPRSARWWPPFGYSRRWVYTYKIIFLL